MQSDIKNLKEIIKKTKCVLQKWHTLIVKSLKTNTAKSSDKRKWFLPKFLQEYLQKSTVFDRSTKNIEFH